MAENRALIPGTMYTHADGLKEAKDLSKNLVGGDFERQYKSKEPCRWRQNILIKIILAVLTVWLLTITVLREVQLSQLRREVDILTANMIVMTASVNKISDNRLLTEFQTLEDTIKATTMTQFVWNAPNPIQPVNLVKSGFSALRIYADEDNLVGDTDKDTVKESRDESLEKLHDLTVLEDDTQPGDDEDMFEDDDDDDEESGDWYMDYDRRGRKVITTNMVRLKPEDFTDAVLKQDSVSNIREIKRILNENPEIDSVLSALPTEKPKEASNEGHKRDRRSFFPEVSSETSPEFVVPNVISRMDERRKTKKYSPDRGVGIKVHTVSRTARNSDDEEGGSRRPFVAAHFHGNTSHLSTSIHEHYKGNGLIRVAHGAAHDVWYPAPWTVASPHPRPTLARNGHIHVHHTGVYLVYVQIYYLDSHDVISWVLHRTNADIDGRETLLQCAQSSHSSERMDKPNSCFSAAALFLRSGDRLAVRNTGGERHSIMEPEKSFIGLIKLADAEEPNEEM